MNRYYLAVDIGASGGRHILGHMEQGKMLTEEIYRFSNGIVKKNNRLVWDVDTLFREILIGMKKCVELDKIPESMGIDTWAVDYVFLDGNDKRIGDAVAYRDSRTEGMDKLVEQVIPQTELYKRTGIQKQIFNTIYQLWAVKEQEPKLFTEAKKLLMIPDYFHFLLTGKAVTEYTNATTTQLVCPEQKTWDMELIRKLGFPEGIFPEIKMAGYELGTLTDEIQKEVGFDCKVVLPATHDTGSAVMAVPGEGDDICYISSGTWSLLGTELMTADCSEQCGFSNFTNEGGYDYRFRFLKNIMGLWIIQSVRKEIAPNLGFGAICDMASKSKIKSLVDCNDDRFLAPQSMTDEIKWACAESGQQIPETVADIAAVVYNSLAECYRKAVGELEKITGKQYDKIHIVGGGSNAEYLNELTAKKTQKTVLAGPAEATAIGNLSAQMIAGREIKDLADARRCIFNSFQIKIYKP